MQINEQLIIKIKVNAKYSVVIKYSVTYYYIIKNNLQTKYKHYTNIIIYILERGINNFK